MRTLAARLGLFFGLSFFLALPAWAQSPVLLFGTTSSGDAVPIGASNASSGLYRLQVVATFASGSTADVYSMGTTVANSQVTVTNASTVLLAASTTRRGVSFVNHSTSVGFYLGTGIVTTANGVLINPGATASFTQSAGAAWQAVTNASTAVCGILAENN